MAVVWARGSLRVILHSECLLVTMADASDRIIIQVAVRYFKAIWQRLVFYGETVVLSGDFNLACFQVEYWLVDSAVTEFQLECFRPARE